MCYSKNWKEWVERITRWSSRVIQKDEILYKWSPIKYNWKYDKFLKFLLPYIKNRKRTGTVSVSNQNTLPSTLTKSQRILPGTLTENENIENSEETQHDENAQFVQSQNEDKLEKKEKLPMIHHYATSFRTLMLICFLTICASQLKNFPIRYKEKVFWNCMWATKNYETYISRQPYQCGCTSSFANSTPLHQNEHSIDNL